MVSAASGRISSLNTHERDRRRGRRAASPAARHRCRRGEQQHPQALARPGRSHPSQLLGWSAAQQDLRRADVPGAVPVEVDGAEYLWAESNGMRSTTDQPGVVRVAPPGSPSSWRSGYSSAAATAASARSTVGRPVHAARSSGSTCSRLTAPVVSVPGLVRGEHGDPGQRLDRLEPLDEHLLAPEPDDGDRLGHAQQQHEPLRHERHDAGDGADAACRGPTRRRSPAGRSRGSTAAGTIAQVTKPRMRSIPLASLGLRGPELLRLGRQAGGVGVVADRRGPRHAAAGGHEAARLDLVAVAPCRRRRTRR